MQSPNSQLSQIRVASIATLLLFFGDDCNLADISAIKLLTFTTYLQQKGLSPQTCAHCLSLLRRILNIANEYNLAENLHIPKFKLPSFDNKRIRFLSKEEAQLLLWTLAQRSILWHDISALALATGLRAKEIFNLRPYNFDRQNMLLYIIDTKTGKNRSVPINATGFSILKKQNPKKYIFSDRQIKQVSPIFRRAVDDCGLNPQGIDRRCKVVFHTLRHTFASWLVQDNVHLSIVSELLGHSDIRMTMRYAHLAPNQSYSAVSKINLHLP